MVTKLAQYPRNADGSPMTVEVGLMTDASGNGGARMVNVPVAPDGSPLDTKAWMFVNAAGSPISIITGDQINTISAATFGVVADSDITGASGTDNTAALQAAATAAAGKKLVLPAGFIKVTNYITIPPYTSIVGTGKFGTIIVGTHAGGGGANAAENARNGSIFYNAAPINTLQGQYSVYQDLNLLNANPANQGAAFYQQCGDEVFCINCAFMAKYGVILEQTEDVNFYNCSMGSNVAGGHGMWIAPGIAPGTAGGVTNVITVNGCHINTNPGTHGVRIEGGGYSHHFIGCDFNGGATGLYCSGTNNISIDKCYFESQSANPVHLSGASSPPITSIRDTFFNSGNASILCTADGGNAGGLEIHNCIFTGGGGVHHPIEGAGVLVRLFISAGSQNATGVAGMTDGIAGGGNSNPIHIDLSQGTNLFYYPLNYGSGVTMQNGVNAAASNANTAQVYYGYQQTSNYRHGIVSKHAPGVLAGNVLEFWMHKGDTAAAGDVPALKMFSIASDIGPSAPQGNFSIGSVDGTNRQLNFRGSGGNIPGFIAQGGDNITMVYSSNDNHTFNAAGGSYVKIANFGIQMLAGHLYGSSGNAAVNCTTNTFVGAGGVSTTGNIATSAGTVTVGGITVLNASGVAVGPIGSAHPGYVAGNWYMPDMSSLSAGAAIAAGHIKMVPFQLFRPITIAALATRVTTVGSSNCQLAIYAHNSATGKPTGTALVNTGNIANTGLGNISANVVAQATLQPGIYWMAINQNDSAGVYQTLSSGNPQTSFLIGSATLNNIMSANSTTQLSLDVTQAFGAWPDLTAGTFAESVGASTAVVAMKAA